MLDDLERAKFPPFEIPAIRNSRHFNHKTESVQVVLGKIKAEADLWIGAGARKLGGLCCE
jgi:hypothetical protein